MESYPALSCLNKSSYRSPKLKPNIIYNIEKGRKLMHRQLTIRVLTADNFKYFVQKDIL
jgi:hypothetical protein